MNCMFWNVNRNSQINSLIIELINEKNIDLVSLAEYVDNVDDLLETISVSTGRRYYMLDKIACQKITIISRYKPTLFTHLSDHIHFTLKGLPYKNGERIIFGFVHFPSKLYRNDKDYDLLTVKLQEAIKHDESLMDTDKTLLFGDFNMNPHEDSMVSIGNLHAVPSRTIAKRGTRIKDCEIYKFFYNPMWNKYGDAIPPTGSYYYSSPNSNCLYWNIFDQVIIRPSLIDTFNPDKIEFITNIGRTCLLRHTIPNSAISDHLPLVFSIT